MYAIYFYCESTKGSNLRLSNLSPTLHLYSYLIEDWSQEIMRKHQSVNNFSSRREKAVAGSAIRLVALVA